MLIAHIQYIGAESMASRYAYQISLFDTESRATGHKFEGLVTSTMKPLESQCSKEGDIFVTTFHQAKTYTDQWANLNFIITMKKLVEEPSQLSFNVNNAIVKQEKKHFFVSDLFSSHFFLPYQEIIQSRVVIIK